MTGFLQILQNPRKAGYNNFPFTAPIDDVGSARTFYTLAERNIAFVAELLAEKIIDEIELLTTVEEIDYWGNGVKVYAEKEDGGCVRYWAKRALVTTSIGVLDKRGDDIYTDSRPMFKPNLPEDKMAALRELYIDDTRSPTSMGEYREVRFQFGETIWGEFNSPGREWISTQSPREKGKFHVFQNLDLEGFHPGTMALKGFLMTDDYLDLKDELEGEGASALVNSLLADSLGRGAFGDGTTNFNCEKALPFAPFPATGAAAPSGTACTWTFFDGTNENWYGAYSTFEVTSVRWECTV